MASPSCPHFNQLTLPPPEGVLRSSNLLPRKLGSKTWNSSFHPTGPLPFCVFSPGIRQVSMFSSACYWHGVVCNLSIGAYEVTPPYKVPHPITIRHMWVPLNISGPFLVALLSQDPLHASGRLPEDHVSQLDRGGALRAGLRRHLAAAARRFGDRRPAVAGGGGVGHGELAESASHAMVSVGGCKSIAHEMGEVVACLKATQPADCG